MLGIAKQIYHVEYSGYHMGKDYTSSCLSWGTSCLNINHRELVCLTSPHNWRKHRISFSSPPISAWWWFYSIFSKTDKFSAQRCPQNLTLIWLIVLENGLWGRTESIASLSDVVFVESKPAQTQEIKLVPRSRRACGESKPFDAHSVRFLPLLTDTLSLLKAKK